MTASLDHMWHKVRPAGGRARGGELGATHTKKTKRDGERAEKWGGGVGGGQPSPPRSTAARKPATHTPGLGAKRHAMLWLARGGRAPAACPH